MFPPIDLYAVLAVSVGVTARVAAEGAGGLSLIKSQVRWLLHLSVAAAWLHILGYPVNRLALPDPPLEVGDRANLIIHPATLALAGLAGAWIFIRQSFRLASSSTPP